MVTTIEVRWRDYNAWQPPIANNMRIPGAPFSILLTVLLALWLAVAIPVFAANPEPAPDSPGVLESASELAAASVEIDGYELFRVRGVTSLPADQRAAAIRNRIVALAADPAFTTDALRAEESGGYVSLMAGKQRIMAVADWDAQAEQASRHDLARTYLERIREAINAYRADRTHQALARDGMYAAAATAALVAAMAVVIGARRKVQVLLRRRLEGHVASVGIQSFEIVRAERILAAISALTRTLFILAGFVVVFAYLSYVLQLFPWLRGTGNRLSDLVTAPLLAMGHDLVAAIPGLLVLAILFAVTRFALKLIRLFFDAVSRGSVNLSNFEPEWALPTYKIVRFLIIVVAVIAGFPYLPGSSSDAFKGITVVLGVMLSLGSSSSIANLIAGYMLTYRRTFKVGDRVQIGDTIGIVSHMRLQTTHVRTIRNEEVIIANSLILSTQVTNFSSLGAKEGLIVHARIGIGYEVPWRQVEAMLQRAAKRTPGIDREPPPFVLYEPFGDFAVNYEINAYTRDVGRVHEVDADLHRNILDDFNEYGVQIMTPAYEGDPKQLKVVPRDRWHTAPAVPAGGPESAAGTSATKG